MCVPDPFAWLLDLLSWWGNLLDNGQHSVRQLAGTLLSAAELVF